MTVRTPLKLDSDNSLIEMTAGEIGRIVRHCKYLYGQNPSVGVTWIDSSGTLGTLSDTRVIAGATSTSTTSLPSESTTAEPGSASDDYARMSDSAASSTTATPDTNNLAFPCYQVSGSIYAMTDSDLYDTFIHPAVTQLVDGTDQPGTFRIHTASTLASHTVVGGSKSVVTVPTFVSSQTSSTTSLTYPTGIEANDIILFTQCQATVSSYAVPTDTVAGTYTQSAVDNADAPSFQICYKVANGDESGTTLSWAESSSATICQVWRGCDYAGTPLEIGGAKSRLTATYDWDYITTTTDNNIIIQVLFLDNDTTTISFADTSSTNVITRARSGASIGSAANFQRFAGTHQPPEATGSSDYWHARAIVLRGEPVTETVNPIFLDSRADTTLYSAGGIGEQLDQPITISEFFLMQTDADSDETFPLPVYIRTDLDSAAQSWVGIQEYDSASINNILSNSIRHVASTVSPSIISYNIDGAGNNRGTGITNTILSGGSGTHVTRQVDADDYRAQEIPDGSPTTVSTSYLRITKA